MLRILAFFLIVLAVGFGFAWLADNPGEVGLTWRGQSVQTSFMVFVVAQLVLLAAVLLLAWLLRLFFRAPHRVSRYFRSRRRERGYQALSNGIIAAGAGDPVLARRMWKRSDRLLKSRQEPLIRFLDAQTAMIEGDHTRARSAFESMERDPETRLLALRGLFLEAERLGDGNAARHYAERAVRIAPHLSWAGGALLEAKAQEGDWDEALRILEAQQNSRLIDQSQSKRLRAVLLTGKAMSVFDRDPGTARTAAVEAAKLAPDLAPAAVIAARALFRLGDLKRGSRVLEQSWTREPHPDVAQTYVHARPGDSTADRLKRAKTLHELRPTHVESSLALAGAALDAGDYALARQEALAAIKAAPRESAYLLMADIEAAEGGGEGRVREWLARAIRAPRDPAWTADGMVAAEWAPVSPVSGRLDAFQWKVPVEHVGAEGALIEGEGQAKGAHASLDHRRFDDLPVVGGTAAAASMGTGTHAEGRESGFAAGGEGGDLAEILDAEPQSGSALAQPGGPTGVNGAGHPDPAEAASTSLGQEGPGTEDTPLHKTHPRSDGSDETVPIPDNPGPVQETDAPGGRFRLF